MASEQTPGAKGASAPRDRLLIIDDDKIFRTYARRVGESVGYETLATEDVAIFREQMRTWRPSVIIVDLSLPGTDGVELLRDLAEAKSTARILIISGSDTKLLSAVETLAKNRGLTIAGTLQKPVRAQDLMDTLEKLKEFEQPLLETALGHAIAHDQLLLEYQPKLDRASNTIHGVEALVRWQHPTRGLVPPDEFISLAEESGLIHDLTRWVFATAVRQAAAWQRDGIALDVAINLSAHNLETLALPDWMEATCTETGVKPATIMLEITESAAMGDPVQTMDVLTRLRLKGFRLSIDDFGTGYSSLVQLRKLPCSELKVDKSFVLAMLQDGDCHTIVEMVIALGQKLRLSVVAEGVETAEIADALKQLGVNQLQGYFISRPIRPEKIPPFVAEFASRQKIEDSRKVLM
jgi:EAL domain-containing protein (putative c-di-GMP-specific phosphodiesterase class I)